MAAAVPTRLGSTDPALALGRVRAVAMPNRPKAAMPASPIQSRRAAKNPMMRANSASSTTVPRINMGLSLVPNWRMANSLTATGVWSITHSPTEMTGPAAPFTRPLTSSATPSAVAAASSAATIPRQRGAPLAGDEGRVATAHVRCRTPGWITSGGRTVSR